MRETALTTRWLAACSGRGSVRLCFVAAPEFRVIRLHTRYRRDLTEERAREKQRAEKLLESAAIKLSAVVTDLHGVTGRDIMNHLIAGERNPKVLAQLARGKSRRRIGREQALEGAGFFTAEHAALLAAMLARIDRVTEEIARLTEIIERLGPPRRSGRPRRDRAGHDPVPHPGPLGIQGRPHSAGQPVG